MSDAKQTWPCVSFLPISVLFLNIVCIMFILVLIKIVNFCILLGVKKVKKYVLKIKAGYLSRDGKDEKSLHFIVESVTLIKQLLEINQEHESYYKFVESDFSNTMYSFV